MTPREQFIRTLKCEIIGGQVPTFELVFFLTMEAFGKVHPIHRFYAQWDQMTAKEKALQINDMADVYIQIAEEYGHSAIFVHPNPGDPDNTRRLLEAIREKSGDTYFLMMHGDVTHPITDGISMMDLSVMMYEEPEKLNQQSQERLDHMLEDLNKIDSGRSLLDGLALCSDYCFNTNPFFSCDMFEELIAPYLKAEIEEYHKLGYYCIKHTDGNVMPILKQIADCKPDAIHSLDPQGGVSIPEARKIVGNDICLIGNVNCGLLQTGTEEDMRTDVMRSLREGMANGRGYIFSTSNCVYTGLPLERYIVMNDLWRQYGNYDLN